MAKKNAVITGGGTGLGLATARIFGKEGARVSILECDGARAEQAEAELRQEGIDAAAFRVDVADADGVAWAFREIAGRYAGIVHILVNNAGIAEFAGVEEATLASWERIMAVNATGTFLSQAALPYMKAQGGGIVNMASIAGQIGIPRMAAYCASKAAVIGLTRQIGLDYTGMGIRVNCLCPGRIAGTELDRWIKAGDTDEATQAKLAKYPIGLVLPAGRNRPGRAVPRLRRIQFHLGCRLDRRWRDDRFMIQTRHNRKEANMGGETLTVGNLKNQKNFVPAKLRVSYQPYAGAMTETAVAAHLLAREVYRRTDIVVLHNGDEYAVAAVRRAETEALFTQLEAVEVLALPGQCVFLDARPKPTWPTPRRGQAGPRARRRRGANRHRARRVRPHQHHPPPRPFADPGRRSRPAGTAEALRHGRTRLKLRQTTRRSAWNCSASSCANCAAKSKPKPISCLAAPAASTTSARRCISSTNARPNAATGL